MRGMGAVTEIKAKGRTERFVVHVDGRPFATVDLDLRQKHDLHVGTELDEAALARLAEDASKLGAWDRATRMLASRGRASEDLHRKLVQKGARREDAEAAVTRLSAAGLLDDGRFAGNYARSKTSAGHGARRIAFDLSRQGVDPKTAKGAIAEALADKTIDADGALERIVERKLRSLARYDEATRNRRLTSFLARRGHGMSDIRAVLERLARRQTP